MGLFDRFRKKEDSVLPSEVDDYYKSELKSRRSSSVLMAILALVVTLVVAAGLFFGVRAIYRAINDDKPSNSNAQESKDNGTKPADTENVAPDNPTESNNDSDASTDASSSDDEENTSSSGNDTPVTGDIPSTGDSPDALPSTGDEGL